MAGQRQRRVVKVLGREYRVRTNAGQRELDEAARLFEERVGQGRGARADMRDATVLGGIALAGEVLELRREREELARRVEGLLERVEGALKAVGDGESRR